MFIAGLSNNRIGVLSGITDIDEEYGSNRDAVYPVPAIEIYASLNGTKYSRIKIFDV